MGWINVGIIVLPLKVESLLLACYFFLFVLHFQLVDCLMKAGQNGFPLC